MNKGEIEVLRLRIRSMKRHQPLYRMLKEELTQLGYWKNKPRGKPFRGGAIGKLLR